MRYIFLVMGVLVLTCWTGESSRTLAQVDPLPPKPIPGPTDPTPKPPAPNPTPAPPTPPPPSPSSMPTVELGAL